MPGASPDQSHSRKINLSEEQLVAAAERLISKNGICLLACDIINSRRFHGFASRNELQQYFMAALGEASREFAGVFPLNTLRTGLNMEQGFVITRGDSAFTGLNDAAAVPGILKFFNERHPLLQLRWAVARDGWDREVLDRIL